MKQKLLRLAALSSSLAMAAGAHAADAVMDPIVASAVSSIDGVKGIAGQFAAPLFALTIVGVGIAIAIKYIKKGKQAA